MPPLFFFFRYAISLWKELLRDVHFCDLSSQVVNNKALDFHISMPLHITFRSSSLVASLLIGTFFFKEKYVFIARFWIRIKSLSCKRYSAEKWLGCFLVSVGICVTTFAGILVSRVAFESDPIREW